MERVAALYVSETTMIINSPGAWNVQEIGFNCGISVDGIPGAGAVHCKS